MKKPLLALAFAAAAHFGAFAQSYTFTKSTATYAALTSPTTASTPAWDESQFQIPIGFNFSLGGSTYSNLVIDSNGALGFLNTPDVKVILAFDADMMDRQIASNPSTINYQLSGNAGSRILKVEWKNAGFWDMANSTQTNDVPYPNDFVNFQVWLYEGSNNVEIHMGSSSITAADAAVIFPNGGSATTILTNIVQSTATTFDGVALQGPAASPSMVTLTSSSSYPALTGYGADGTVYSFAAKVTGVSKNIDKAKFNVYPNPVSDVLKIEGLSATTGNISLKVSDVTGKEVMRKDIPAAGLMELNVSDLNKGTYLLEVSNGSERAAKSIIKQ